ncbi:MAG: hypothetical protein IT167_08140 [Bryobacterales bacterium]|nr:hypothetical protein [Bryobacterales bacterium]
MDNSTRTLATYLAGGLNRLAAQWDRKRALIRTPAALKQRNALVRGARAGALPPARG